MLESDKLLKQIEKENNIDLSNYKWPEELKEEIYKIKLDRWIEDKISTMEEVYNQGLNIGKCGLTSRYLMINLKDCDMHVGKCNLLIGTAAAPNGEHAWITRNGYVIDTTLMLIMKEEKAESLGYIKEKTLARESAKMLSESETYSREIIKTTSK